MKVKGSIQISERKMLPTNISIAQKLFFRNEEDIGFPREIKVEGVHHYESFLTRNAEGSSLS